MKTIYLFLSALVAFLGPVSVQAGEREASLNAGVVESNSIDQLVQIALDLKLNDDPYWHVLLHYRRGGFRGVNSLVDDPAFFNAPDGKTNSRNELEATLRAFFKPYDAANEMDHAICRFPARFCWLDEKLPLNRSELPADTCEAFDRAYEFLNPTSVTLIFPAAYMGGPGSMFGHTLLVFDSDGKSRLLSRAVNYAAQTPETMGPLFTIMGLAGFYKGNYQILPYYDKVEEYGDISHRDMWEYELNLTEEEVARTFAHTWEMQNTFSYYYFLNENCAYNLLFLVEAGRPSLELTENFRLLAIPIDTVKLVQHRGAVARTLFRPSKSTRILAMADSLTDEEKQLAIQVARGFASPSDVLDVIPDKDVQIRLLDLAAEYAQYLYVEKVIEPERYRKRFLPILKERSTLGAVPDDFYDIPAPSRPDAGHNAGLTSLGGGVRDGDGYASLAWRLSYHSLIDNNLGFELGAHLQFFNTEIQYADQEGVELERLDVVDVVSLVPRNDFFKSPSWKVSAGLVRERLSREKDQLVGQFNFGSGFSYDVGRAGRLFAMWDSDIRIGPAYASEFAIGLGMHVGQVVTFTESLHMVNSIKSGYRFSPNNYWVTDVESALTLRVSVNVSFSATYEMNQVDSFESHDVKASLRVYY